MFSVILRRALLLLVIIITDQGYQLNDGNGVMAMTKKMLFITIFTDIVAITSIRNNSNHKTDQEIYQLNGNDDNDYHDNEDVNGGHETIQDTICSASAFTPTLLLLQGMTDKKASKR